MACSAVSARPAAHAAAKASSPSAAATKQELRQAGTDSADSIDSASFRVWSRDKNDTTPIRGLPPHLFGIYQRYDFTVDRQFALGGKGEKDRYIPLPARTFTLLRRQWLTHRNPVWLFRAGAGARQDPHTVMVPITGTSLEQTGSIQRRRDRALGSGRDEWQALVTRTAAKGFSGSLMTVMRWAGRQQQMVPPPPSSRRGRNKEREAGQSKQSHRYEPAVWRAGCCGGRTRSRQIPSSAGAYRMYPV